MINSIINWIIDEGVSRFLQLLLILITLWTIRIYLAQSVRNRLNEYRYRRLRKIRIDLAAVRERQYKTAFGRHLYFLVKTTSKEKTDHDVTAFLVITLLLYMFTFVLTYRSFDDLVLSGSLGALVALVPYLVLQVKLRSLRYVIGNDVLLLTQMLAQQYNAAQYNIYYALTETAKGISNPKLHQVFVKLISDLQVSRNEEEIRHSIELFVYTAGSSWVKRLGNIILKAYLYDEKVLTALLNLSQQIEDTAAMLEEEKAHTMDSVYNGYLTAPLFIASLFLGYYVARPQGWVNIQFKEYWSFLLFTVCVVAVIFSIIISLILKRPKNDI